MTTPANKTLTPTERRVLTYVEQEYLLNGHVPTLEAAVNAGFTKKAYADFLENAHTRNALLIRGVSLAPSSNSVLTPEQLAAANLMLDLRDNRSQRNKLKDLNVSTQKWEAWLRDPAFQSYLQRRSENMLGDNLHESHLALVDRVRSGDVNAIKYYNEITGRYIPQSSAKVDVNAILMRVLEIIQEHVRDPETLSLVAEKLLDLSTVNPALLSNRQPMRIIEAVADEDVGTTTAL